MRKSIEVILISLAVIGVVVIGASSVRAASFGSRVTIHFDAAGAARDVFRGRVFSPSESCRSKRRVVVFRRHHGPDTRIGSDRSEDNGRWSVDVEGHAAPGRYYANAPRRDLASGNFCEGDRSRTITIG
jgi:hypothetical protein